MVPPDTTPSPSPRKNQRASRRQQPRSSTKARVYKNTLGLGSNIAVSVLDLSETGVRLVLKENLQVGQEVEVNLESASYRPVKTIARVIWSVEMANGQFCVGARFQKAIAWADLAALAKP